MHAINTYISKYNIKHSFHGTRSYYGHYMYKYFEKCIIRLPYIYSKHRNLNHLINNLNEQK